jgi:hypothetical protein
MSLGLRHQLGSLERRQQRLARKLDRLLHVVRVAFEEARANESGCNRTGFVNHSEGGRR